MILNEIIKPILENSGEISFTEAAALAQYSDKTALYAAADLIRKQFCGNEFDTCSIINARSGLCGEDCQWCAQSAKYKTGVNTYPLLDADKILDCALKNDSTGVKRFALVTSGRRVEKEEMRKLCEIAKNIRKKTGLKLCASMGLTGKEELRMLKDAGVSRYHCNLETAASLFQKLCSTHTQEEKKQTLFAAKECGMEICSGGIIGMGESMEQRIELACDLRSLGAQSVPVNILNPAQGTPLENAAPLSGDEIVTTMAVFRFILPGAFIRFAGGRAKMSEALQEQAFRAGVNAAMVGDLLTTTGPNIEKDYALFKRAGYDTERK